MDEFPSSGIFLYFVGAAPDLFGWKDYVMLWFYLELLCLFVNRIRGNSLNTP